MEIKELKEQYKSLEKKYGLPSFKELDECFEISKIENSADTVLKSVRKEMMDKVVSSLGFVEMLLNPMNAPRMYHAFIKSMTVEEKDSLEKIYISFGELNLLSLAREIDYDEKGEAELLKKIFGVWTEMKPEFRRIISGLLKPNSKLEKKDRSYFG